MENDLTGRLKKRREANTELIAIHTRSMVRGEMTSDELKEKVEAVMGNERMLMQLHQLHVELDSTLWKLIDGSQTEDEFMHTMFLITRECERTRREIERTLLFERDDDEPESPETSYDDDRDAKIEALGNTLADSLTDLLRAFEGDEIAAGEVEQEAWKVARIRNAEND